MENLSNFLSLIYPSGKYMFGAFGNQIICVDLWLYENDGGTLFPGVMFFTWYIGSINTFKHYSVKIIMNFALQVICYFNK